MALTGAVDELLPTAGLDPLAGPSPDVAVNLHGCGPESTQILRALHPGVSIAHAHLEPPGVPGPQWEIDVHEVYRWCRLLDHFGIPDDPADLTLARPLVLSPVPAAVVMHPGCAFVARHWPAQRYAVVAREVTSTGLPVVVTGNADQRPLALQIAAAAGRPQRSVLASQTSLAQLAALVADASLVVCSDTGIAHLAPAYGTPSVVLFGPMSPHHSTGARRRSVPRTWRCGQAAPGHLRRPSPSRPVCCVLPWCHPTRHPQQVPDDRHYHAPHLARLLQRDAATPHCR